MFVCAPVNALESALVDLYEDKQFQVEQNLHLRETGVGGAAASRYPSLFSLELFDGFEDDVADDGQGS